jgi:hypothetical protein
MSEALRWSGYKNSPLKEGSKGHFRQSCATSGSIRNHNQLRLAHAGLYADKVHEDAFLAVVESFCRLQ